MSTATEQLNFTVLHRGTSHALTLPHDATVADLQDKMEELTGVERANQKLLLKGKKISDPSDGSVTVSAKLGDVGVRSGVKMQLLGSSSQELGHINAVEKELNRVQGILNDRAQKGTVKVRSTASSSSASTLSYRFHTISPLPHLPHPAEAQRLLERLASDPAIVHIMQSHQYTVGLLSELAPHEHPDKLGVNVNRGQEIRLRIRTDRYDGFRIYSEVRRVLCHELTHNVWGDHDDNFKALNSRLNREVAEFERARAAGTKYLSPSAADMYEPSTELEAQARAQVLGGSNSNSSSSSSSDRMISAVAALELGDEREDMRRRTLDAATRRLRREEEELEQSCGTAGPAAKT